MCFNCQYCLQSSFRFSNVVIVAPLLWKDEILFTTKKKSKRVVTEVNARLFFVFF